MSHFSTILLFKGWLIFSPLIQTNSGGTCFTCSYDDERCYGKVRFCLPEYRPQQEYHSWNAGLTCLILGRQVKWYTPTCALIPLQPCLWEQRLKKVSNHCVSLMQWIPPSSLSKKELNKILLQDHMYSISKNIQWLTKAQSLKSPSKKMPCLDLFNQSTTRHLKTSTEYFFSFFFFFFLAAPCSLWDLSSPTRDWTQAEAVKSQNPNH